MAKLTLEPDSWVLPEGFQSQDLPTIKRIAEIAHLAAQKEHLDDESERELSLAQRESWRIHEETEGNRIENQIRQIHLQSEVRLRDLTDNRQMHFLAPVTDETVEHGIQQVKTWTWLDRNKRGLEYEVIINSPGGEVDSGLAFYDSLTQVESVYGHKLTTGCVGTAASMGGVLLQAGSHRWMGKNAYILIHEMKVSMIGKPGEIKDLQRLLDILEVRIIDILTSKSKITESQIRDAWDRKDWYIGADAALKLGLVDEIR